MKTGTFNAKTLNGRSRSPKAGTRIITMEQRNSLLLVVVVAIGAIAVGLQAADEKNANYTTHILALPDAI